MILMMDTKEAVEVFLLTIIFSVVNRFLDVHIAEFRELPADASIAVISVVVCTCH